MSVVSSQGLTSRITDDLAMTTLPDAFFFSSCSLRRCSRIFSCSESSSSPNRSKSSSFLAAAAPGVVPEAAAGLPVAQAARSSVDHEAMCFAQRATWGNFLASGACVEVWPNTVASL
eukprot:Mycagemm_TRINITY_DN9945_c0_g1::TRINITY_DN9945_c0_g1_i1::g.3312::m.3312 type:complete len:117 gc:universal TRINITY_DN9945_c0_g1_i1:504-154(-)